MRGTRLDCAEKPVQDEDRMLLATGPAWQEVPIPTRRF